MMSRILSYKVIITDDPSRSQIRRTIHAWPRRLPPGSASSASSSMARESRPDRPTRCASPYDDALVAVDPPRRAGGDRGGDRRRRRARSRRRGSCRRGSAPRCSAADRRRRSRAPRGVRAHDRARGRQADQDGARRGDRAAFTFRVAAEETKRIYGEIVPLDWLPGNEGRDGARPPRPARAGRRHHAVQLPAQPRRAQGRAGARRRQPDRRCGPASQTPISALKLAQIVARGRLAGGGRSRSSRATTADAAPLVEDERIKLLTFTGSPAVGWGAEEPRRHASA